MPSSLPAIYRSRRSGSGDSSWCAGLSSCHPSPPLPGIAEIRELGTFQVAEFDTYTPLLSLPHLFGTTLETIPALIPYLDAALLRRRKAIALPPPPATPRCKIGLVWAGSPTHQNDRHRSSALAAFLPVVRTPGIAFYSVQKGERSQELRQLPPDCTVHDLDALIRDYGDTALLLDALDLLISVDTAVAHLAGALGKPVWLLLPEVPDWRWGLEGETSPWYSSMRLFRQTRRGDWAGVMARVAEALGQWG